MGTLTAYRIRPTWPLHRSKQLLWLGQLADAVTIVPLLLLAGADAEANPLMAEIWRLSGPVGVLAFKLAAVLLILEMCRRLPTPVQARVVASLGGLVGLLGFALNSFALLQIARVI